MSNLKEKIKEAYSGVVTEETANGCGCTATSDCCGTGTELAGFSEDYSNLPGYNPDADYGLGCGIPVAFAGIEKGNTVLDLGSGAGNDVFVARSLVGETGKVIGVDMTPAMIEKANANKQKLGFKNVEFVLGDIEELPLKENSVDVVISNCVLNLVSDKLATYKGIYKVLKQGGHFSISDVVVSGELTEKMKSIVELYAGCIAGAMVKDEYLTTIEKAGFKNVEVKKEKVVYLPDNFLLQYFKQNELEEFRNSGVQVLSITINGIKEERVPEVMKVESNFNFLELAKSRYSVRKYQNRAVETEKLTALLEAGRVAPTAANLQPCIFLVLNDKQAIEKLALACNPHGAPLAIVVCADKNIAWVRPFDKASMIEVDSTIAADHIMMCAQDLGLSSCWITYFNPVIVRKAFNIPDNLVPVNILAIGYGNDKSQSSDRHTQTRKPLNSIVKYTTF
jgi:ubiquinone/menaquinone biosynthesis C-methylase UbiE/nitroreductase